MTKHSFMYFYIQQLNTVRSPLFFREIVDAMGPPPPLPLGILYSSQFRSHQDTKMAAGRTQRSPSPQSHGKQGTVKSLQQFRLIRAHLFKAPSIPGSVKLSIVDDLQGNTCSPDSLISSIFHLLGSSISCSQLQRRPESVALIYADNFPYGLQSLSEKM